MTPFQERIRGIIPAILTALDEKFAVDPQAMRRSARRLLDNGCQGVVVVGTSGEFAGIDDDLVGTETSHPFTSRFGAYHGDDFGAER